MRSDESGIFISVASLIQDEKEKTIKKKIIILK
jgi:hypothetical protein